MAGTSVLPAPNAAAPRTVSEAVLIETLKQKQNDASALIGHYVKAFTIFVAVTGGLIKFALDQNATAQLRNALSMMGIGVSVLALFVCIMGHKLRQTAHAEIGRLYAELHIPIEPEPLTALKFTTVVGVLCAFLSLLGWIYILR
jgi:hypothetical protein